MRKIPAIISVLLFSAASLLAQSTDVVPDSVLFAGEKHFKNIQQLTFGGDNAEAYFSYDGKYITFQRTNDSPEIIEALDTIKFTPLEIFIITMFQGIKVGGKDIVPTWMFVFQI